MLTLVKHSQPEGKLGGCAATYRAAPGNMFGTCPQSCQSMPAGASGAKRIDRKYLAALLAAVPKGGASWTYTHFKPNQWMAAWFTRLASGAPTTTVNQSADTERQAARLIQANIPTVLAVPADVEPRKAWRAHGARFVRCPAEYQDVTCRTCGGGKPLCARPWRDYIIAFHAHGASKARIGKAEKGGCYAAVGRVRMKWEKLAASAATDDAKKLLAWSSSLPAGSLLRHHVAGDFGRAAPTT